MKTKQILKAMNILSWIIFIGLCIKTGALIISFFVSLFVNDQAAKNLYLGLDFSHLYDFSTTYYVIIVCFVILIVILKAYLFYLIIKIFRAFDFDRPFSEAVAKLLSKISYFSFYTSVIAILASAYSLWLINQVVFLPFNWGAQELLFMTGVIFIVSFLFKRAVDIQSENELTI